MPQKIRCLAWLPPSALPRRFNKCIWPSCSLANLLTTFLRTVLYFSFTWRESVARNAWGDLVMKLFKTLYEVSVLLLIILLSAPWATGQSTFGGGGGVVKDPSQSAVEGAELTPRTWMNIQSARPLRTATVDLNTHQRI